MTDAPDPGAARRNLALATAVFTINFWAWNLVAPLGSTAESVLRLTPTQVSVLVATPVLVGSLGRIPVGALTDRYGGRAMFAIITFATIVPVLMVAAAGSRYSFVGLVAAGFLLGIAGTTFAVGIPFVNAWFTPEHRGKATGIFGAGMGGTALSAFFTPRLVRWLGGSTEITEVGFMRTHWLMAGALAVTGVIVLLFMRDSPAWQPNTAPVVPKLKDAARLPVTWQMSILYAVTFGGFVAFSTYLPTYLVNIYDFVPTEAGTRAAGFAVAAVVARPIGGALSDRLHPRPVTFISLIGAALSVVAVLILELVQGGGRPDPEFPVAVSFLLLAFFLGLGTGAVFAWVALLAPAEKVGTVTGLVGAAGGLGGYFPPMLLGATYNAAGPAYTIGLSMLLVTLLATVAFVSRVLSTGRSPR